MSTPLRGKGALINTEQAGNSGRCCQGGSHSKNHITNTCTREILFYSLSCDERCWGLLSLWRKLMCPYKYANTPHRCNFQYSLPNSAKETIFFTSAVSQVAVLSWTKELLTCLELDTGGKNDFGKASISYSKHRAASNHNCPKQNHSLGEGRNQWASCSKYSSCFLIWRTCLYHIWEQVQRVKSG